MSACIHCGRECLDPHDEEVDIDALLDQADACPFHGRDCAAVGFADTDKTWPTCQVVYDCGALGPKADNEEEAVKNANGRDQ